MSSSSGRFPARVPAGLSTGGQFTTGARGESRVDLAPEKAPALAAAAAAGRAAVLARVDKLDGAVSDEDWARADVLGSPSALLFTGNELRDQAYDLVRQAHATPPGMWELDERPLMYGRARGLLDLALWGADLGGGVEPLTGRDHERRITLSLRAMDDRADAERRADAAAKHERARARRRGWFRAFGDFMIGKR